MGLADEEKNGPDAVYGGRRAIFEMAARRKTTAPTTAAVDRLKSAVGQSAEMDQAAYHRLADALLHNSRMLAHDEHGDHFLFATFGYYFEASRLTRAEIVAVSAPPKRCDWRGCHGCGVESDSPYLPACFG